MRTSSPWGRVSSGATRVRFRRVYSRAASPPPSTKMRGELGLTPLAGQKPRSGQFGDGHSAGTRLRTSILNQAFRAAILSAMLCSTVPALAKAPPPDAFAQATEGLQRVDGLLPLY